MNDGAVKVPCKGCTDRNAFCHSSCERYEAFCKEMDKRKKAKQLEIILDDVQYTGQRRMMKAHNKLKQFQRRLP